MQNSYFTGHLSQTLLAQSLPEALSERKLY